MTRNESNWNPWIKIEPQGVSAVNRRLNRGKKLVNRNDRIQRSDHLTLISFIGHFEFCSYQRKLFLNSFGVKIWNWSTWVGRYQTDPPGVQVLDWPSPRKTVQSEPLYLTKRGLTWSCVMEPLKWIILPPTRIILLAWWISYINYVINIQIGTLRYFNSEVK